MKKGTPINLRVGRTTVVTLPSGEEVALEPEREKGHLVLRITAPDGARIDHRKTDDEDSATKWPCSATQIESAPSIRT